MLEAEGRARGIAIIPEFDVPGHTNAALHAMPGLNPDGICPPVYEGGRVGFSTLSTAAPDTGRFLDELVQVWDPRLESDSVARATRRGVRLLVSPADHIYLDMKQRADQRLGLDWMGVIPLRQAVEWEPTDVVAHAAPGCIEGVEACLWTETVVTESDLGQMILPRLSAAAEVAWAGTGVGQWESYRERVAALARLWRSRGWSFFPDEGVDWR